MPRQANQEASQSTPDPITSTLSCCGLGCWSRVAARCRAKFREHQPIWNIIAAFIPLVSYTTDVTTDIITSEEYIASGDYWWGGFTIAFTVLPLVITCIMNIVLLSGSCKNAMFQIARAPLFSFYILLKNFVNSIREYPNNNLNDIDEDDLAGYIKLIDVLSESLPQSMIQTYVASQVLRAGETIDTFQWVSIASSLTALAYGVATLSWIFVNPKTISKVAFGMFGLLAVTSRLVVCAMYAIHYSPFWFIPFCSMVVATVLAWAIVRNCPFFGCITLADESHRDCSLGGIIFVIFTWIINTFINSFTLPGLLVSSVTLFYALGALALNVSQPIVITAITLAAVSWVSNIITLLPCFESIRLDWLSKYEGDTPAGASTLY